MTNPGGLDDRTWNRLKTMNHVQIAAYSDASNALVTAMANSVRSTGLIRRIWEKHPTKTLGDLREAMKDDPRTVVLIETATSDWRRVAELQAELLAKGWLDADEVSVVLDANGDPMLVQGLAAS
jgi:hypothetical protein